MAPDPFQRKIRLALADEHLQAALDANAERRQAARTTAYSTLPGEAEAWRARAHAVRAETIAHLEEHLEAFRRNADANGWQVYEAASSAQAVKLVLEIAARHGAWRIAKSKTMLSEEIGLNQALQAAGLEVVETDLGEWIVQLRGEHPAHIITPAVHLTRADVGRTFQEKLGLPYSDDVQVLTAAARKSLRQVFFEAEIGLTGANFGVVESGQICLVSNEGNARMVSTLPPVHIALLGIERLVPTLQDLALMLTLLPRAASGLKSTVYTSLIGGPRLAGESDGPRERHLILVDNGRTGLLQSPLSEALLCIRCGACLNACPVFREIGGHAYVGRQGDLSPYPGPIGQVLAPGLLGPDFDALARASSLCGACREACPVDIDLPGLLLKVRAGLAPSSSTPNLSSQNRGIQLPEDASISGRSANTSARWQKRRGAVPGALSWGLRLYTFLATSPARFAAAQRLAGFFGRLLARPSEPKGQRWLRLPAFTGWGQGRDFPAPDPRPFRQRWAALSAQPAQPQGNEMPVPQEPPQSSLSPTAGEASNFPEPAERFLAETRARGCMTLTCSPDALPARLLDFCKTRNITSLLAWEASHMPSGLLEALERAGLRLAHRLDPEAQAGLTGALGGIAETGALALAGGPGRPLSASLLPELHIAILKEKQIYPDTAAFFRAVGSPHSLTLISGPSRTADIEMTLTVGVHGPKEVLVICLSEGS